MASALALTFEILARDKASKTFDKVGNSADKAGRAGEKFGSIMGKGVAGGALAAGAGLGALAFAAKGWIEEARESAKIGRLTEAVVKSTGGAAKISAAQVGALAESISNKTAIDDEAIQSGANLLLTFTKVRNEVGAGNDILNQATQAAADMSVALGTDITGASIQLGKALNDPIKGVTALSKAGVSFTQQQKDQIKAMVEAGDVLGAQKIILGEMATQFGGAAAAAADPLARLQVIAGNLGEKIGTALLPYVESLANYLIEKGVPAFEQFAGWVDTNRDSIEKFGLGVASMTTSVVEGFLRMAQGALNGLAIMADGLNVQAQASFDFADKVLTAFELALGWLPGFDSKFKAARAILDVYGRQVDKTLTGAAGNLRKAGDAAGTAADKVNGFQKRLDEIRSKTITVTVDYQQVGSITSVPYRQRALGGPAYGGEPYLVGERGPELMVPRQSGTVIPASRTASLLAGGTPTPGDNIVNVYVSGSVVGIDDLVGAVSGGIARNTSTRGRF